METQHSKNFKLQMPVKIVVLTFAILSFNLNPGKMSDDFLDDELCDGCYRKSTKGIPLLERMVLLFNQDGILLARHYRNDKAETKESKYFERSDDQAYTMKLGNTCFLAKLDSLFCESLQKKSVIFQRSKIPMFSVQITLSKLLFISLQSSCSKSGLNKHESFPKRVSSNVNNQPKGVFEGSKILRESDEYSFYFALIVCLELMNNFSRLSSMYF